MVLHFLAFLDQVAFVVQMLLQVFEFVVQVFLLVMRGRRLVRCSSERVISVRLRLFTLSLLLIAHSWVNNLLG